MQKNPKAFYAFKKNYNSIQVSHGFEHDFKRDPTDPDRGQTRLPADVSIPTFGVED